MKLTNGYHNKGYHVISFIVMCICFFILSICNVSFWKGLIIACIVGVIFEEIWKHFKG